MSRITEEQSSRVGNAAHLESVRSQRSMPRKTGSLTSLC